MAYAALVSLAQTTDLIRVPDKYFISVNEKEKITCIREYVMFLTSFLEDFPEKACRLEGKIRDVANEAEAIIEDYMWKKNRLSWRSSIGLSRLEFELQLRKVTQKIGSIVEETMDERFVGDSAAGVVPTSKDDVVIGLDEDLIAIKDRLCGVSSKLQVIPIVGMGGVGKTTLARNAYDDPLIVGYFHIRAWITVSLDYSVQKLVSSFIYSMLEELLMLGKKFDELSMEEKVYKILKGRRYLIVMDDVWSTNVWDDVRNIFPDDGNGSRIMLTTRLLDVATYPDSNSPLHQMRLMNDHRSWNLLKEKVFTNGNCPVELEDVGEEIARRCVGLPLAVVLVAGVLSAVNTTRASWEEIARNVNNVVELELEEILSLSYTHLPHQLRPCFLFIGGFPEDEIIRASRLIKLWVAEGFLNHQNGCSSSKSLEEGAEEYLEDLVKRNLVIVTSRKSNGKIKSCSLHDMVRDSCIRKAHQEKFLHVMDGRVLPQGMINVRRISFSRCDADNIWGPNIHTILCFQVEDFRSWLAFGVLDAAGDNHKELLSQVFELFHLRYLSLIGSFKIPSAISNLVNLQTLIIRPSFRKWKRNWREIRNASHFSLPLEIWRLLQLRHLVFYAPHMLPHPPHGSNLPLQNLQTLFPVKNLVWNEKILQMIPNVKRLGLVYTISQDYHLHHLKCLHQLEKLEVIGYHMFSWQWQSPSFPTTLKKLTLVGGGYNWEDMGIIGSLPNLEVLKLLDYACNGETWETADEEFPQLKFLLIDKSHLQHWITESSHFPRLECLVLLSCWGLSTIPEGIGEIPTLELIELNYVEKSLLESAMQMKEYQESYGNYALQVRFDSFEGEESEIFPWRFSDNSTGSEK